MNGCFLRVRNNNRNSKICVIDGQAVVSKIRGE